MFKKILIDESLLFIRAGAGAGEKISRSRSKMDRLRNTAEKGPAEKTLFVNNTYPYLKEKTVPVNVTSVSTVGLVLIVFVSSKYIYQNKFGQNKNP